MRGMDLATLPDDLPALHAGLVAVLREAGAVAMRDYSPGRFTTARVENKKGGSPVTAADLAVDAFLAAELPRLAPFAYHSEERPESWQGNAAPAFVIDPIDGTRNFVEGGDAWCIVAGVLAGGRAIAGAVYIPARGEMFSAYAGGGAFLNENRITAGSLPSKPFRTLGPRPALEHAASRYGLALEHKETLPALAHRVIAPLRGDSDLAIARPGGHDWDIVASDCILREAGGRILTFRGEAPDYTLLGAEHPALIAGSLDLLAEIRPSLLTAKT